MSIESKTPSPEALAAAKEICDKHVARMVADQCLQPIALIIDREYAEEVKELVEEPKFPSLQEMRRAVSGCAAIARHDASVAKVKGLHGDQLKSLEEYANTLRAAADFLAAALSTQSPAQK